MNMPNPIWTESNGLVSVIGSYKQAVNGQVHAIIRNHGDSNRAPYRTLCETYISLHFISSDGSFTQNGHKLYIHNLPFRNITCKKCLHIIHNSKRVTRPTRPPKQKKFFLVTYDEGDMEELVSLTKLLEKVEYYGSRIVKIRLVDSHRIISMKTILADENGKEITEEDI